MTALFKQLYKSGITNRGFFLIVVLMLSVSPLFSQSSCDCETYSRAVKKDYEVFPTVLVNISNKYGPVSVEGWDQNRIRIETLTEVQAASEEAATEVFSRISTDVSIQKRLVNIQTAIEPANPTWWPFPETQTEDYSVAIRVLLPKAAALSLLNKHGDVSLRNIMGNVSAEVISGDVFGSKIKGEVTLNHKDGTINLEKITRLNADLANVEGSLTSADWIKVRSRSTTLKFRNILKLESETRYDNYYIDGGGSFSNQGRFDEIALDQVKEVKIRSSLSRLYLDEIRYKIDLEADSSRVRITDMPPKFEQISLEGRFTDFRVVLEPTVSCQVRAEGRHAGIRYPRSLQVIEETETSERHSVNGYFGQRYAGAGLVLASIDYGGLTIEAD